MLQVVAASAASPEMHDIIDALLRSMNSVTQVVSQDQPRAKTTYVFCKLLTFHGFTNTI